VLPLYIICSETSVQDKESNLLTLCNVIEKLTITGPSSPGMDSQRPIVPILRLHATAVWIREEGDEGREFEARFTITPPGQPPIDLPLTKFKIPSPAHLQRLRFVYDGPPFFTAGGVLTITSQVRPAGSDSPWRSQAYVIPVEVDEAAAKAFAEAAPEAGGDPPTDGGRP